MHSNTIFCPYTTLHVLSLPLWKGVNNDPYFLPGNTDSKWGEMACSQGAASSRALPPACQSQDPLTLMLN